MSRWTLFYNKRLAIYASLFFPSVHPGMGDFVSTLFPYQGASMGYFERFVSMTPVPSPPLVELAASDYFGSIASTSAVFHVKSPQGSIPSHGHSLRWVLDEKIPYLAKDSHEITGALIPLVRSGVSL